MKFTIILDTRAIHDIQEAIDYYDEKQIGLGIKFENHLDTYFKSISKNPFYQNRYDQIHCLPLKKFPFMIHFSVNEQSFEIFIHAIINTSRNPKEYWIK